MKNNQVIDSPIAAFLAREQVGGGGGEPFTLLGNYPALTTKVPRGLTSFGAQTSERESCVMVLINLLVFFFRRIPEGRKKVHARHTFFSRAHISGVYTFNGFEGGGRARTSPLFVIITAE